MSDIFPVKLTVSRHGQLIHSDFLSVSDAAQDACLDLEYEQSFPVRISTKDKIVWQFDGNPCGKSMEALRSLAKENVKP